VWTFDAMIVTYIGGIGTLFGPLIGAFFFVLVRNVLAANLVNIHLVIFGIVFIIVVLAVPGGFVDVFNKLVQRVRPAAPSDVERELVKNV
jgi:branched-chain amino acid transport system permease protein